MTGITSIQRDFNESPNIVRILTTDTLATVSAANYILNQADNIAALNNGAFQWVASDFALVAAADGWGLYSISADFNSLNPYSPSGAAFVVADSTSSATPGTIRAFTGKMTSTATTMTSGNLVGVRGELDVIGASGGFWYGVQGKIIPTGTLSGSLWAAPVFGQFDIHAATVNGAQLACIWGDYGATSGTISDASGMRGVAMTNTTAAVLNAQDYRYGNATYLLELAGAGGTLNYYLSAGTSGGSAGDAAHCAAQKVIKIEINGTPAYIPIFTQNT